MKLSALFAENLAVFAQLLSRSFQAVSFTVSIIVWAGSRGNRRPCAGPRDHAARRQPHNGHLDVARNVLGSAFGPPRQPADVAIHHVGPLPVRIDSLASGRQLFREVDFRDLLNGA